MHSEEGEEEEGEGEGEGEEQIHIVMGKRLSGCDTFAIAPGLSGGWMFMMNMMTGGPIGILSESNGVKWSSPFRFNQSNLAGVASRPYGAGNSMMNFGFTPFGGFGWIFMILWWALIIAGIVALIKWLMSQSCGGPSVGGGKSALDILKERYAKGEIDKKEFEERKKDLN